MDKLKTKISSILNVLRKKEVFKKNILVFGDVIFDNYVIGDVYRMSPEASVPVLSPINTEWRLGGAANVFNIIISLGGNANICTVLGNDYEGGLIKNKLSHLNKNTDLIFTDRSRKTTKKTRFLAKNGKHLLRVDEEDSDPINKILINHVVNKVKSKINEFDILLISDYDKGFVTDYLINQIINIFNYQGKIVLTDPKSKNIDKYRGSYLIKPNQNEFINFIGNNKFNMEVPYITIQGKVLLDKSHSEYIYVTLGEKGGILIGKSIESKIITAHGNLAIDITGAGDTVIATIALALSADIEIEEAIYFSSYAAGASVQKIGTAPICLEEIEQLIQIEMERSNGQVS